MKILVIGSGGREHALAWKLAQSARVSEVLVAPGNAGTATEGGCRNVPVKVTDIEGLLKLAQDEGVALTVVGPEVPLVLGVVDAFRAAGLRIFGPSAAAAQLEGSKAFAKDFLARHGIPTAFYQVHTDVDAALAYVREKGAPIVIKADGLAAGKGVVVAATLEEAEAAVTDMLDGGIHGAAGAAILVEECLIGEEVSFFALCDGTHALPLVGAQDHKRVGDGDTGPNTGGMGAYSPAPAFTEALQAEAMERIVRPTLAEMARRGTPFRGVLFAGLMLTAQGPKLIEYNVRFGDPECQVLMTRLRSDLLAALLAACDGELKDFDLRWSSDPAMVVVMAARGYPGPYVKNTAIRGLDEAGAVPGVVVYHAGTSAGPGGEVLATGGRVLGITATAPTLRGARDAAYAAVDALDWPEGFCRRDIGWRALGAG